MANKNVNKAKQIPVVASDLTQFGEKQQSSGSKLINLLLDPNTNLKPMSVSQLFGHPFFTVHCEDAKYIHMSEARIRDTEELQKWYNSIDEEETLMDMSEEDFVDDLKLIVRCNQEIEK